MPNQPQITIIGLGQIGASFGLALKRQQTSLHILGHDRSKAAVERVKQLGAIDSSHWNLIASCENADVILLAIPVAGIAPTLKVIADDLKPGCLIIDTATIKAPVMEAARELLPTNSNFVGGDPVVMQNAQPGSLPTADLFDKAIWALCPAANVSPEAIRAAADLVSAVGASPLFLDPDEHDGLIALMDGLPTLLSVAFMHMASSHDVWREARKLGGFQFETAVYLPDLEPQDVGVALSGNAANLARWIDALIGELRAWQQALNGADDDAILQWTADALDRRAQWYRLRSRGDWDTPDRPEDYPSYWRSLFAGIRQPGVDRPNRKR